MRGKMKNIYTTEIENLVIEGIEGDYVFETIRNSHNFYENELLDKWFPYIKDSKVIFDIGANLGNHTLYWASKTDYERIYSFEPFYANYERLKNNIGANHFDNVFPINKGVGSCVGYSTVTAFSEENYGGTTLDINVKESGDIEIIDIDSFADENQLETIDFIKIDTEGFEESILSGLKETLSAYHPDLWIEVSQNSFQSVINLLEPMGYIIADIGGFNMLFLYSERHPDVHPVRIQYILEQNFYNLDRVNKYYSDYTTAKKWLSAKDDRLTILQQQLEQDGENCKQYETLLLSFLQEQNEQIQVMNLAKKTIQKQQQKFQQLKDNALIYQRRWEKLTSKWYVRFALKIYYQLRIHNILK